MMTVSGTWPAQRRSKRRLFFAVLTVAMAALGVRAEDRDFTAMELEELLSLSVYANSGNVLTSHIHRQRDWMFGYRFRCMEMSHNHDGSREVPLEVVLAEFPVALISMATQMHTLAAMYAPSDELTVMAMLPYLRREMDHLTRGGHRFPTHSAGPGDVKLTANWAAYRDPDSDSRLTVSAGANLPTGSIDETDSTPAGPDQPLPYPMQLGSGTYDLRLALGYLGLKPSWAWGIHTEYTHRLGKNARGYALGQRLDVEGWVTRGWTDWLSSSLRLHAHTWGNIDGADAALDPLIAVWSWVGRCTRPSTGRSFRSIDCLA